MNTKHKTLTLEEKMKVIEEHEKNKRPAKELIVLFKVGKTQIYHILRNKSKIKDEWVKGTAGHVKRKIKSTDYDDINRSMYQWFVSARAKGIPISGPLIQSEALETAKKLDKNYFKASNGWLESFKHRHNIVFNPNCGEAKKRCSNETSKEVFLETNIPIRASVETNIPVHASAETQDVTVENLHPIPHLCKQENLSDNPEDIIKFDNKLTTTQDVRSTVDIASENSGCEIKEEIMDDDYEGNEREFKIHSFEEALSVVSGLQEFAAFKNVPDLLELMQHAKDIINHSLMKKSQECILKDMWKQRKKERNLNYNAYLQNEIKHYM